MPPAEMYDITVQTNHRLNCIFVCHTNITMTSTPSAEHRLKLAYSEVDEAESIEERLAHFHLMPKDFVPIKGLKDYRAELHFLYRLTWQYGVWNQNVQEKISSWNTRLLVLGAYNTAIILSPLAPWWYLNR